MVLLTGPWTETPFGYYFDRPDVTVVPPGPDAPATRIRDAVRAHADVWISFAYTDAAAHRAGGHERFGVPHVAARRCVGITVSRFERTDEGERRGRAEMRSPTDAGEARPGARALTAVTAD